MKFTFKEHLIEETYLTEEVSPQMLRRVEKYADDIFRKLKIDVEFGGHFRKRVNRHIRDTKKPIGYMELIRLFTGAYKEHGPKIVKMNSKAQAVLKDMETDINMPFMIMKRAGDKMMQLIPKTIIRGGRGRGGSFTAQMGQLPKKTFAIGKRFVSRLDKRNKGWRAHKDDPSWGSGGMKSIRNTARKKATITVKKRRSYTRP